MSESWIGNELAAWSIEEVPGASVYITSKFDDLDDSPENEIVKARYAHEARFLAQRALRLMEQADSTLMDDAATVISELATNALKYGGNLSELDVVYTDEPETVYVVTVNPAADEPGVPRKEHMGETVAREGNASAERGRGLVITDALTGGEWGQYNVVGRDGRRQIVTYAILHAGLPDQGANMTNKAA